VSAGGSKIWDAPSGSDERRGFYDKKPGMNMLCGFCCSQWIRFSILRHSAAGFLVRRFLHAKSEQQRLPTAPRAR
jgi:hypothetical protein